MSLAGSGAVAIWHDIAPAARDEFYAWHGREHMPERAAIPGFLRGRRFAAVHGTPEYFNLYETASPAVTTGADYLERLNHPTPWTIAAVAHFRGVARALCEVAASVGEGSGGLVATFRYTIEEGAGPAHRAKMAGEIIPGLAAAPGAAGAHLLVADAAASAVETEERKARPGRNLVPGWIVIVESWGDLAPFVQQAEGFARSQAFAALGVVPDWAIYRLQNERLAKQDAAFR